MLSNNRSSGRYKQRQMWKRKLQKLGIQCRHGTITGFKVYCEMEEVTVSKPLIFSVTPILQYELSPNNYRSPASKKLYSHLVLLCSVARRGNRPGPIESFGASNPKPHPRRKMMRRHRLALMMRLTSFPSWSLRTNTPVTWATESVTISLSLQPSAWR